MGELIDEEEYALIKLVKESKQAYRDAFERHRSMKTDVIQIEHSMQQCKTRLVGAFEEWYEGRFGAQLKAHEADPGIGGERYDPQETFDLMQAERLETQHPDALAYHMRGRMPRGRRARLEDETLDTCEIA